MKQEPLVSVITPAYNADRFIADTIQSVISQQYQNWEHLIVVDCNSKDKTEEIIRQYATQDSRIKLIKSPDAKGAAANRNIALEASRGSYIAFIDADDLWTPDKLSKQISFMLKNDYFFSFTGFRRINEDNTQQGHIHTVPEKVSYSDLLLNNTIACLSVVFKKQELSDIRFQEHGWEDMSFWLQILKRVDFAYGLNECLALYRIVKGSRSNNKLFAAKLRWNTYRLVENFSILKSIYLFAIYFITAVTKYRKF